MVLGFENRNVHLKCIKPGKSYTHGAQYFLFILFTLRLLWHPEPFCLFLALIVNLPQFTVIWRESQYLGIEEIPRSDCVRNCLDY